MPSLVRNLEFVVRRRKSTHYKLPTTHFKEKHGFTLIELLVVISIIAILVASATTSWRNAQMKSRDGKRKSDLKAVQQALENYFQVNGSYPNYESSTGKILCIGDTIAKDWGSTFMCNGVTYMQQLPKDVGTIPYYFTSTANCSPSFCSYTLSANLENTNDPDIVANCGPAGRNYCVKNP